MEIDYSENEKKLRKKIEIVDTSFAAYGMEVLNVGVQYADMLGGKGIRFFCELQANKKLPKKAEYEIKVNVYTSRGELISMGSTRFAGNKFTGYDTFSIGVFHNSIQDNAAKAKVYLSCRM